MIAKTTTKSAAMCVLLAILALATIAAAQGPCSVDKDCPQSMIDPQICTNARCMPKDCTIKGCQPFHKGTYCIAGQCQPRLTENKTCTWDPRANFATREQPCEAGLVCSGSPFGLKCVRNGPGPTDLNGKPDFPDLAAQSAAEKKDDSIPPRPVIDPNEPTGMKPADWGPQWWHFALMGVIGVAVITAFVMALKERRKWLRSFKDIVEARKKKLEAETAAALAQVNSKPAAADGGQAGLAAPASLTVQSGQQGGNVQPGTVVQIPIEEYLAMQQHRQQQQQSASPVPVVSPSAQHGVQR